MSTYFFRESSLANWKEWYGVDFSSLSQANAPESFRIFARPHQPRDWVRLSEPVLLADVDFSTGHPPRVVSENLILATQQGLINGIVVYFELELSPGVILSVDPKTVGEDCSWRLPVWLLPAPLEVKPGDRLRCTYAYGAENRHGRVSIAKAAP